MAESDSGGERYTVRSVARALGILDELASAPQEGRSVTEIAEASGMSKSATFAVLQTMISLNFVADSGTGQNRRYHLGMALARLGDLAREQLSIGSVARPTLQQLSSDLHGSVRLGILDGDHVSMIDRVDAPSGLRIDLRMGNEERLHSTAVGKAILAALDDRQVEELLAGRPLSRQTPQTLTTKRALLNDLNAIRGRGYSIDDEEDFEGVLCLGAAIRDSTGAPVAAISVTTLKAHATPKRIEHIGSSLAVGAGQISRRLGHSGESVPADDDKTGTRGNGTTR